MGGLRLWPASASGRPRGSKGKMPDETVDILLQIRNDQRELKKMQANFDDVRKSVAKVDEKLKKTFGSGASWLDDFNKQFRTGFNIGTGAFAAEKAIDGVLASLRGLRDFINRGIQFDATVEQSQVAFETLLGDAEAAKDRIEDLITFAARTPFRLPEIIDANRQLQVLSDGALAGADGLRIVGDAAAATGRPFEQVAFWIGRAYAGLKSGTPVGEATLRLIEMGLVSGETALELNRLAKESRSAEEAFAIISDTFSETEGAMERQSRTFVGLRSTLADTLDQIAGDMARPIFDTLKQSMEELLELVGALPTQFEDAVIRIQRAADQALKAARGASSVEEGRAGLLGDIKSLEDERRRLEEINKLLTESGASAAVLERNYNKLKFAGAVDTDPLLKELSKLFDQDGAINTDRLNGIPKEIDEVSKAILRLRRQLAVQNEAPTLDLFELFPLSESELESEIARIEALSVRRDSLRRELLTNQTIFFGGAPSLSGNTAESNFGSTAERVQAERQLADIEKEFARKVELEEQLNQLKSIGRSQEIANTNKLASEEEARINGAEAERKRLLNSEDQISKQLETQLELNAKQVGTLEERRAAVQAILDKEKEALSVKLADQELLIESKRSENDKLSDQEKKLANEKLLKEQKEITATAEKEFKIAELRLTREIYKLDEQIAAEKRKTTQEDFSTRVKAGDLLLDQIKHEKSLLSIDGLKGSERAKFNLLVAEEKRLLGEKALLLEEEYNWLVSIGELEKAAAKRSEIQNTWQAADKAGLGNEEKTRFQRANDDRLTLGDPESSFQTIKEAATAAIWEFEMQAGTVADQIHEHLLSIQDSLHGSISNSIAGLIDGTMSFGEAWQSVAQTIGTSVVKAIADMAAQWLVAQAAMRAASLLGIQTEAVASTAAASASAVAWAPAATASLIATLGASSASAALLPTAAAANSAALGAMSSAAAIPGFESGGEPMGRNAIIQVNENGQEVVVNNRGWRNFGSSFFEGVNAGTITPATLRGETVGSVDGVGAPGINLHVYNDLESAEQYLNSGRGEDHFIRLSRTTRDTAQEH